MFLFGGPTSLGPCQVGSKALKVIFDFILRIRGGILGDAEEAHPGRRDNGGSPAQVPKRAMSKTSSDGLARLQNESRISASTWRQWCNLLKMDSREAIDVWKEICHPIMIANRKVPEIPYILQLRCQRPQLNIFEFKEEIAKVLNLITFLYTLDDECLVKGKVKSALLKLYRNVSAKMSPTEPYTAFIDRFLIEACMMVLVTKVLKGPNVNLAGVLKPLVEGRGPIVQVMRLGTKSLEEEPYSDTVRECLQEHFLDPNAKIFSSPTNGESSATSGGDDDADAVDDVEDEDDGYEEDADVDEADDDDDDDEYDDDDADEDEADDEEDEADDDDDDDDEEEDDDDDEEDEYDDDDDDDADDPVDIFLLKFKTALHSIYEVESGATDDADEVPDEDPVLEARLKATAVFDPLHASIPSMEEAQNIARRAELARSPRKLHKVAPAPIGGGASAGVSVAVEVVGPQALLRLPWPPRKPHQAALNVPEMPLSRDLRPARMVRLKAGSTWTTSRLLTSTQLTTWTRPG